MSDAQKRLQDALGRREESYEDREAREDQERSDALGFFEQTIVPGFQAAANEITQQAATNASMHEPPLYAEVQEGPRSHDFMSTELVVRRGEAVEFWFRGIARMRTLPTEWTYRRNPRVKNDGTLTSEGTERELKWNVLRAETTAEQVRDDLLMRFTEVLEVRNRRTWR